MVKGQVTGCHWLPKSEYRFCPAPEVWKDVTEDVLVVSRGEYSNLVYGGENIRIDNGGYRIRKVLRYETDFAATARYAFIVEKKVSE